MKKKSSTKARKQIKGFEPTKVGLLVSIVAVVSIVMFAILAVIR